MEDEDKLRKLITEIVQKEIDAYEKKRKYDHIAIIGVRDNDAVAQNIAKYLGKELVMVERTIFEDLERLLELKRNLNGMNAYVVSTLGLKQEPTISMWDTFLVGDALKGTCKVNKVIGVVPDLWYAAQDKTHSRRQALSARVVAKFMKATGYDHLITIQLHSEQLEGQYESMDHLKGIPIVADYIKRNYTDAKGFIPVSPDGGANRPRDELANDLGAKVKGVGEYSGKRDRYSRDEKKRGFYKGDPVEGLDVIIFDDMGRTLGTMINCAEEVNKLGAKRIIGAFPHMKNFGTEKFLDNLAKGYLHELVVFNTRPEIVGMIQGNEFMRKTMTVLDISNYLAEAILRYEMGGTAKEMIKEVPVDKLYTVLHKAENTKA